MRKTLIWLIPALSLSALPAMAETVAPPRTAAEKQALRSRLDAEVDKQFRKTDSNRDGKISRAELTAVSPKNAAYFDLVDMNRDGTLSREELSAVASLMFENWVAKNG